MSEMILCETAKQFNEQLHAEEALFIASSGWLWHIRNCHGTCEPHL